MSKQVTTLDLQVTLYREMQKKALAQKELCLTADFAEPENLDRLIGLLTDRQKLMTRANFPESGNRPTETASIEEKLTELCQLQSRIAALDAQSQAVFSSKLDSLKSKMKTIQTGKQLSRAYRSPQQVPSYFIDQSNF